MKVLFQNKLRNKTFCVDCGGTKRSKVTRTKHSQITELGTKIALYFYPVICSLSNKGWFLIKIRGIVKMRSGSMTVTSVQTLELLN